MSGSGEIIKTARDVSPATTLEVFYWLVLTLVGLYVLFRPSSIYGFQNRNSVGLITGIPPLGGVLILLEHPIPYL